MKRALIIAGLTAGAVWMYRKQKKNNPRSSGLLPELQTNRVTFRCEPIRLNQLKYSLKV